MNELALARCDCSWHDTFFYPYCGPKSWVLPRSLFDELEAILARLIEDDAWAFVYCDDQISEDEVRAALSKPDSVLGEDFGEEQAIDRVLDCGRLGFGLCADGCGVLAYAREESVLRPVDPLHFGC